MNESLLAVEIIGIFTVAFVILTPILCWVLPHHFSTPWKQHYLSFLGLFLAHHKDIDGIQFTKGGHVALFCGHLKVQKK